MASSSAAGTSRFYSPQDLLDPNELGLPCERKEGKYLEIGREVLNLLLHVGLGKISMPELDLQSALQRQAIGRERKGQLREVGLRQDAVPA